MSIHQVLTRARSAKELCALGLTLAVGLGWANDAHADAKPILCPKGEKRTAVSVDELDYRFDYSPIALPFAAWLSFAPQAAVDPGLFRQPLSEISEWNQWMSGLAERWNGCALTRAELDSGVPRIYARLKGDAAALDKLREARLAAPAGQPGDAKKLADALAGFDADLRELARLAGRELVLDRIAADIRAEELHQKGDLQGAYEVLTQALTRAEAALGPEHPEVATLAGSLGALLQAKGDYEGAEKNVRRALAIDEKVFGPEHQKVAMDANALSQILITKPDNAGAVAFARRALAIGEKTFSPSSPAIALFSYNLSLVLVATGGDVGEQEQLARRALGVAKKAYGSDVPQVATMSSLLGMIRRSQGFLEEAMSLFEEAYRILVATYGAESQQAKDAVLQVEITRGMMPS
ncbi:MAG TPA: tetratricopeptide repeat protein [Thermoanaerobaculia bacterium]|jgi:tetratricopeptide (TPR) repeat protein|nr:tetratricopeptide repeat protein [Thermoanaerobaculia bacterium]